jgi:predicted Rossmann fold flavoprotein
MPFNRTERDLPAIIESVDVVVIGGGAAGLMCAIEAGKRGRSVVVLERSASIGRKIRISGGGRCNFTNIHTSSENYISENPHFHKSALSRYTPDDFIRLVQKHKIPYHEKKLGQLFCDGSSQQIVNMLLAECQRSRVRIRLSCHASDVRKEGVHFFLASNLGNLQCQSLVIATGGLSVPKAGATDFGYQVARRVGLKVTGTHAGLVPFILDDPQGRAFRDLSGVSLDARVRLGRISFRENVLFTHHGLSGPAILQISSYWKPEESIIIDAMPEPDIAVPKRFLKRWHDVYGQPLDQIHNWILRPSGSEGFAKAEVTVGGVDTHELSSRTMEALRIPGLHFIGEVVDVTGHLGGFNFQWAWSSGWVAGQYV